MYANWGTLKHATSGSYDIGEGKEGLMFPFHISIRALSLLRCKAFFHDVKLFCALNNRTPNYQERKAFTNHIFIFHWLQNEIWCENVSTAHFLLSDASFTLSVIILLSCLLYFCLGNLHQKTASINWQGSNFRAASQMEKNPRFSSIFHNSKNINRLIGDKLSWL